MDELQCVVYMLVLDDPVSPRAVNDQVRRINSVKASGRNGVPPGIVKQLPVAWLLCITTLFNNIFIFALYTSPG